MTRLTMVGITHRGAPLALLERVAIRREDRPGLLALLRVPGCSETVLLSTCSRVELYVGNASPGLTSRVLGEVEILAQTRTAFREAAAAGMSGPVLGRLFPAAMRSGSRVRAETTLGEYGRSLAHQAVDVGMTSLARSPDPMVLVVGSGQMAQAAVDHLAGLGIHPAVAARDEMYAARLAGTGAVCPLPALTRGITAADLLICATSAAQHVVTVGQVSQAMAGRTRPLTVVDMSVPRNVDAAVAQVPGVTLIDLEGLAEVGLAEVGLADVSLTGVDPAWSGSHAQRIAV